MYSKFFLLKNNKIFRGLIAVQFYSNGGMYNWLPETLNRLAIFRQESHDEYASFCHVVEYQRQVNVAAVTKEPLLKSYDSELTSTTISSQAPDEYFCTEYVDVSVYIYMGVLGVIQCANLGIMALLSNTCDKKYILCK